MDQEHSLFRKQVVEEAGVPWLGSVRLATPVSCQWWTLAALGVGVAIVVWLFAGHYTRRVTVTGLLVPKTGLITITANTTGIVDHIAMAEGDHVHAGDTLVFLSGEHISQAVGNTSAEISHQLHDEASSLQKDATDLQLLTNQQADDFRTQSSMLQGQLHQIDDQLAIQKKQIDMVQELIGKWTPLLAKGYISSLEVEQEQSTLLSDESQIKVLNQQRFSTAQQLSALRDQLAQLPLAASAKLNDLRRQHAQIEQALAQNEVARATVLRATENGLISSMLVKSGESVSPGQPLLTVMSDGSVLQAQLLVPSQAIGFVHPGTRVSLHYQAFPYQKFGLQHGTVRSISRNALTPSEVNQLLGGGQPSSSGDSLYLVRVDVDSQSVRAYEHDEPLKPGMALDANLLLDRRRVVEWIFEPLYGMGRRLAKASS